MYKLWKLLYVLFVIVYFSHYVGAVPAVLPREYDIIYVNAPRIGGDLQTSKIPDVSNPLALPPGSNLVVLEKDQTVPKVLIDTLGKGAIFDPVLSYDGKWVYFSWCYDVENLNIQRNLPRTGCDIWKYKFSTGEKFQLTQWETMWRKQPLPNKQWSKDTQYADPPGSMYLGYGIFNMAPVPLSIDEEQYSKFLFTSNANNLVPVGNAEKKVSGTNVVMQMFIFDSRTGEFELFWPSPASCLHPIMTSTGKILASCQANQGTRDNRPWEILRWEQDGSEFSPVYSGIMDALHARHGCTTTRGNYAICSVYYLSFNFLGALQKAPLFPSPSTQFPAFGPPEANQNVAIQAGPFRTVRSSFTPTGMETLTPFTHFFDEPAPLVNGVYAGKVGWPWVAPNDTILVSASKGPVHIKLSGSVDTPMPDLGIYEIVNGISVNAFEEMRDVVNDPLYNEVFARAVVPWEQVYGGVHPIQDAKVKNDGKISKWLPAGTPWSIVGSSSVYNRQSKAGQSAPGWSGQHSDYGRSDSYTNFNSQGGDAYNFRNDEIRSIRIIAQSGVQWESYNSQFGQANPNHFLSATGNERLRTIAEVPLLKFDALGTLLYDKWGNPDTSFKVLVPCRTAFTFDLVGEYGQTLSHAFTWHATACGEVRTNCGGCHAHNLPEHKFEETLSANDKLPPVISNLTGYTFEYREDIEPIFLEKCSSCHNTTLKAGNIDFTDGTLVKSVPRSYAQIFHDQSGEISGIIPLFYLSSKRDSFFAMRMSAFRSNVVAAIFNRRLDNISNNMFYTEGIRGDRNTLDMQAKTYTTDIDYFSIPEHENLGLTDSQRFAIINFIDSGAPINIDMNTTWKLDTFSPVISFFVNAKRIIFGTVDIGSGVDISTIQITKNGQIVPFRVLARNRYSVPYSPGVWKFEVLDFAKNVANRSVIFE